MVLNNLSADGDEGKTNVILKRIVDEVHAEDVKKEEEATALGIGRFYLLLFFFFLNYLFETVIRKYSNLTKYCVRIEGG